MEADEIGGNKTRVRKKRDGMRKEKRMEEKMQREKRFENKKEMKWVGEEKEEKRDGWIDG